MNQILVALRTALQSTATTSWFQSLGGRVYLDEAPANVQLPLCRYSVVSHDIEPIYQTDVKGWERLSIEFEQFFPHSSGAHVASLSAEALDGVLDNLELKPTGYDRVVLRAESRGVTAMDDDAIVARSTFRAIGVRVNTTPQTT